MTTTSDRPADEEELADRAAPLDALLIDAALGTARRFAPDASTVKFVASLARRPQHHRAAAGRSGHRTRPDRHRHLGADARPSGDRRFGQARPGRSNPLLRRTLHGYLAAGLAADQLVTDAGLGWRDEKRVRFRPGEPRGALSPSNVPLLNPASAKAAIDSGGMNLVRGGISLLRDLASPAAGT